MIIIQNLRIKYFRSILSTARGGQQVINTNHLNVFVGQNDAGKSNVLRALNLFFNNECDVAVPFEFLRDFSIQRIGKKKEVSRIEIEIIIKPPSKQNFQNKGPIKWTKIWYRDGKVDENIVYVNGESFRADGKSGIYKWLRKIRYRYVPAIKSKEYFDRLMYDLYEIFQKDTNELENAFNHQVKEKTLKITNEINKRLELNSVLQFRGSFRELFNTLEFGGEDGVMLSQRGDGIKIRHIPVILQNIAEEELSPQFKRDAGCSTIIAFEEPENNLEFKFEKKLAETFFQYANKISYNEDDLKNIDEGVQIFLTTHSPIFYSLQNQNPLQVNTFYVGKKEDESSEIRPIPKTSKGQSDIEKEMDLDELIKLSNIWLDITENQNQLKKNLLNLNQKYENTIRPVVITEGYTDVKIFEAAYLKLYPDKKRKFDIIYGNTHPENFKTGGTGGSGILKHFVNSVQPDSKITIVIWDNDQEGKKDFNSLGNDFEINPLKKYHKIHKNRKAHAVYLPASEDRLSYEKAGNLCIEHYFDKSDFKDEKGNFLKVSPKVLKNRVGIETIETRLEGDQYLEIKDGKKIFAEKIVPELPQSSFLRFRELFETIDEIISTQL